MLQALNRLLEAIWVLRRLWQPSVAQEGQPTSWALSVKDKEQLSKFSSIKLNSLLCLPAAACISRPQVSECPTRPSLTQPRRLTSSTCICGTQRSCPQCTWICGAEFGRASCCTPRRQVFCLLCCRGTSLLVPFLDRGQCSQGLDATSRACRISFEFSSGWRLVPVGVSRSTGTPPRPSSTAPDHDR